MKDIDIVNDRQSSSCCRSTIYGSESLPSLALIAGSFFLFYLIMQNLVETGKRKKRHITESDDKGKLAIAAIAICCVYLNKSAGISIF